jgi:hypothetical protein
MGVIPNQLLEGTSFTPICTVSNPIAGCGADSMPPKYGAAKFEIQPEKL